MSKTASSVRVPESWAVFTAPVGATEPANATAALDAAWSPLGHTSEDGVTFTDERDVTRIETGDLYHPIRDKVLSYSSMASFVLDQYDRQTLELLDATVDETTGNTVVTPAFKGELTARAYLFEVQADGATIRRIYRSAVVGEMDEITVAKGEKMAYGIDLWAQADDTTAPYVELTDASGMASA